MFRDVVRARAEWPAYLLIPLVLAQAVLLVPAFRKANRYGASNFDIILDHVHVRFPPLYHSTPHAPLNMLY